MTLITITLCTAVAFLLGKFLTDRKWEADIAQAQAEHEANLAATRNEMIRELEQEAADLVQELEHRKADRATDAPIGAQLARELGFSYTELKTTSNARQPECPDCTTPMQQNWIVQQAACADGDWCQTWSIRCVTCGRTTSKTKHDRQCNNINHGDTE